MNNFKLATLGETSPELVKTFLYDRIATADFLERELQKLGPFLEPDMYRPK